MIDYTTVEPGEAVDTLDPDGIDALIDLVGIPELSASLAARVHAGGRVVSVVMPPDVEGLAARGVTGALTSRLVAEDRFPEFAARIAAGELKLPTIQAFPFAEADAAFALQATRHVRGKLVLVL